VVRVSPGFGGRWEPSFWVYFRIIYELLDEYYSLIYEFVGSIDTILHILAVCFAERHRERSDFPVCFIKLERLVSD